MFLTLPTALGVDDGVPGDEFWHYCSDGKVDAIKQALTEHPSWANAKTPNGESPLHLTGIFGHAKATEYLLKMGADPNVRSSWEQGLRMHPLSWNVYGGYVDNIKLLIKYGADVNADFDTMAGSDENAKAVTALDIALQLASHEDDSDNRFEVLVDILRKNGAKTMNELQRKTNQEL